MAKLTSLIARTILDSRGNPTVEVDAQLDSGAFGRAAVPSGASTGTHEVHELRDEDTAFMGKGVSAAVTNVNTIIAQQLLGTEISSQEHFDQQLRDLDDTENLSNLGANAILGVSLALAHALADEQDLALYEYVSNLTGATAQVPTPMFNIMNGGAHTDWQSTDIQEFMVIPHAAGSFFEAVQWGSEIYHHLKALLKDAGYSTLLGDEGGFAPAVASDTEALTFVTNAIKAAGYEPGTQVSIGLDVAASEFYSDGKYVLPMQKKTLSSQEMKEYVLQLVADFPIMTVEDGLAEDDWQTWPELTAELGGVLSIGDDHLVTNPVRIQRAIEEGTCNGLLMKVNQIGTLTDSLQAISLAHQAGWQVAVSHRSGETEDTSIADIAVGAGVKFLKSGSLARGERTAKYNQVIRIEEELQS